MNLATWRETLLRTRYELIAVALITGVGLFLRIWQIEDIPPGLHGDEALTGLRADVILREGWIGVFDPLHGAGQPAGAEYWTAALVWLFGNNVFVLRFAMALLATATLPLAYLLYRLVAGRPVALIGLALLTFSGWHLHYSRLALPPVVLPLFEVVTALLLLVALRAKRWWLFVLAGVPFGLGLYTYNGYPFFAIAVGIFLAGWLALNRREWTRTLGAHIALFMAVALLVGTPMFLYAANHQDQYFALARRDSLFNAEHYKAAEGLLGKADVILDSGKDFVQGAVFEAHFDGVDGSGTTGPMLDLVTSVALGLGILFALRRWRQPGITLALIVVLLLPWAGILTIGSGTYRRAIGVVPFVPLLAALPLAFLWEEGSKRGVRLAAGAGIILALLVGGVASSNLSSYFGSYEDHPDARWVFAADIAEASRYIDALPGDPYVYFYSGRWSFNYETRRYLAPDSEGEDRSNEFGTFSLELDRTGDVVYVFLAPYLEQADEVERLFPGGTRFDSVNTDGTGRFRAYFLSQAERFDEREGTPAPGAATPGPSVTPVVRPTAIIGLGAGQRDAVRQQDLVAVQGALEEYRQENGSYPDTGGGIQSLCAFADLDAGCVLRDILGALPQDPLGNGPNDGYWYSSTGVEFTLYARRESAQLPECPEHPSHLGEIDSLFCVQGP